MTMITFETFSNTLLALHGTAQAQPVGRYQDAALEVVNRVLPFDKAWWGIMSSEGQGFRLHSSHPFALDDGFVPLWEEVKTEDNVAKAVRETPRKTVHFDEQRLAETKGLETLTSEHGIAQALCTSMYLPSETAFVFLSLYRSKAGPRFTAEERTLNEYLMPHIACSWVNNRVFQMELLKANASSRGTAVAILDRQHNVLDAEPDFTALIRREWPRWDGDGLPTVVVQWLQTAEPALKLLQVVMRWHAFGEFRMLVVRERTRVDLLTRREEAIAQAFSLGQSYKLIACHLEISPATVRHHLRAIYEKLKVTDKGELASLLRQTDFPRPDPDLQQRFRDLSADR